MNCEHDVFEEVHKQFQEEMKAVVQVANPVQAPAPLQLRHEWNHPSFQSATIMTIQALQLLQNARRALEQQRRTNTRLGAWTWTWTWT